MKPMLVVQIFELPRETCFQELVVEIFKDGQDAGEEFLEREWLKARRE